MARKGLTKKKGPSFPIREPEVKHLKPKKFAHYLTIGELAREIGKDVSWIKRLERQGRLPEGVRHRVGLIEVRLYPPARVEEIRQIFNQMRRGRPKKGN